ncbi:uncharacterized protein G2W53_039210 [Senna tora]|uniref:Uncharacterized protein n=1 Tax=Senna tora TaxID=362788 RepID=A0A834W7S2_9FABA|nr:uncharacterized protein G2W53_039210 [Senna tora]
MKTLNSFLFLLFLAALLLLPQGLANEADHYMPQRFRKINCGRICKGIIKRRPELPPIPSPPPPRYKRPPYKKPPALDGTHV